MDKTAAIESVRKYAERVRRDFNVNKVILFGSHAKGTAREDSDIDVAVVFESIDGKYGTGMNLFISQLISSDNLYPWRISRRDRPPSLPPTA